MKRVAVVTGANRGLGFEACRQLARKGYQVLLTARDSAKGEEAARKLQSEGLDVRFHPLDVTKEGSIQELRSHLEKNVGRVDVLVNNAGILPDKTGEGFDFASAFRANLDTIKKAVETNVYGPFLLSQQLIPLMRKNGYGRIVNVSSGMGQLVEMEGGWPGYRISKTALNAVTRIFSEETKDSNILVNSLCPGWVKTDMGGEDADREIEEGVDTIVWLATLPDGSPTGGFFRDRQPIPW